MNDFQELLDVVNEGQAILVASEEWGLPTIHQVGHSLKTESEVTHCGWGLFTAKVMLRTISFDAGGAMNRSGKVSWTRLRADEMQLEYMGYDLDAVKARLEELVAEEVEQ